MPDVRTEKKKGGAVKKQAGGAIKAAAKAVKPTAEQAAKMASQQAEMALKNRAMQELKAQFEDLPLGQQPQGWMSPERLQQKIEEIRRREATPVGGQIPLMQAGGAVKAAARAAKAAAKDASSVLPAAEREANLVKFQAESKDPRRFYHGTLKDFSVPHTGNHDAFFVSPSPHFASRYAMDDLSWFSGKNTGAPTGGNVMPVYVQTKNPFDFENKQHVESVIPSFRKVLREQEGYDKPKIDAWLSKFRNGDWSAVELASQYDLLKNKGFDSYYVMESGVKNLGVYNPSQIKSAIGNRGTFDTKNPDITKKKGGKVKFTDNLDAMRLAVQKRK
jgi:hypothetical protein